MGRCKHTRNFNGFPCPCGNCIDCRKKHAQGWGFRIALEAERLGSAFFVTLTYAVAPRAYRVKVGKNNDYEYYNLTKRNTVDIDHLQKFLKRLRKSQQTEIKYYGVSEYGDETMRPHYHVIIMGIDLLRFVGPDQWEQIKIGKLQLDGESIFHVDTWKHGHITIGECSPASVNYTLKYISEGRQIPEYPGDDRQREKSIMSKGMGKIYLTDEMRKLHANDPERQYCVTKESHKIPLPRYLKERLYDSLERQMLAECYQNREIDERNKMGEIELKRHMQKLRQQPKDERAKNTYGRKGKI